MEDSGFEIEKANCRGPCAWALIPNHVNSLLKTGLVEGDVSLPDRICLNYQTPTEVFRQALRGAL
jgi:hypothetical protein